MIKEFFDDIFDPEKIGIFGELQYVPVVAVKNRCRVLLLKSVGYLLAFAVLSSHFMTGFPAFFWYVLLPVFIEGVMVIIFGLWARASQGRDEAYYNSLKYIVQGVLIYFVMYSNIIVIYHDVPSVWIFLLLPVAISSFYKDFRWFKLQTAVQMVFFVAAMLLRQVGLPYHLPYTPPLLNIIFFAVGAFQFAHILIVQDRLKVGTALRSREIADREKVQRLFASNLSRDCSQYLAGIDDACEDILKNGESEDVNKYTEHIMKANDMLRNAIMSVKSMDEEGTEVKDEEAVH